MKATLLVRRAKGAAVFDLQAESAALARGEGARFSALDGARVLVTGATGLVGSHIARFLLERNRELGAGTRLVALVRDEDRARRVLDGYGEADGLSFAVGDVSTFADKDLACDYIVHCAAPTASAFFSARPIETILTIVDGAYCMLELARAQDAGLVCLSSMEVYGDGNAEAGLAHKLGERDLGYLDPLALRSCYPQSKRMAEQMAAAYAAEHGVRAKSVRLAQCFGPGVPKDDGRVFSQFARAALAGDDIVLKTSGASTRMYCDVSDAVTGVLTVLLRGVDGMAYNVANEATYCSVKEMAGLVAAQLGDGRTQVRVEVDPDAPYPPEHHLPLDTSAVRALGWRPVHGLSDMYARLAAWLQG